MNHPKRILLSITFILLSLYFGMPVIHFQFWGLPTVLLIVVAFWILSDNNLITAKNPGRPNTHYNVKMNRTLMTILIAVLLYMSVFPLVTSWALFRTNDYRSMIGNIEEGDDISKHIAPISLEKIRVVDESLAVTLGDKVLGAQPALGSQVILGRFSIQKVNNELYWVAPLLHSGFFKWMKNKSGTNGYVMVNATNERDVKLVQQANGQDIHIKYQPNSFFFMNLERYLYFNGYCTKALIDYTFEIDDQGKPYWVITRYKKTIGFYGEEAIGVVTVDVASGEMNEYSIENTPEWIDRIQPDYFIAKQLNDWGKYVKGYWNFANEEKLQITEGLTLVYGENNRAYWYTGLTSVGSDEATVGFVLVDTRTKKATWYKQGGATEWAAQQSAQGKVQEKGYYASLPIPYNINNIPTYVMTLKDQGGLVKMYAMVAIEDYTIVGVGNSMHETLMAFKNAFNMTGNRITPQSETQKMKLESVITRIGSDIKNGNTFYYFMLEGSPKIYIGSSQISDQLPITTIGDSVLVTFDDDALKIIDVSTFKNKNIQQ